MSASVGYLTIGNSHDTAEFVCDNIARIWKDYLQWIYPKATTICILCDGGGSNSASHHIFKQELLKLAKSLELDIIIVHYPPYCSKYNPIEHKLFAHITRSWNGVPLLPAEYACKKANKTTTSKELVVVASINSKEYQTQRTLDKWFIPYWVTYFITYQFPLYPKRLLPCIHIQVLEKDMYF